MRGYNAVPGISGSPTGTETLNQQPVVLQDSGSSPVILISLFIRGFLFEDCSFKLKQAAHKFGEACFNLSRWPLPSLQGA